jgi:hypothetical protein
MQSDKRKRLEANGWRVGTAEEFLGLNKQETAIVETITVMSKNHPLLDVSRDEVVPYFMWDYRYTVGQIKSVLTEKNEEKKIWLMAKIMRDARYADVWKFISLQDFLKYRQRLMPRLGREKPFWEFLYSRWIKQGIVKDIDESN